jgi:MFS family permease
MLLFGKIYTFYSTKSVYLAAILLFEIGSLICGAAPSSTAFIVGRAVAGAGSAGVFSGAIVIIVHTSPLEKRPLFQGLFGAVFGLAAVIGPLLGGALTDRSSWRWCMFAFSRWALCFSAALRAVARLSF